MPNPNEHISLETAKLFEGCEIESKYIWIYCESFCYGMSDEWYLSEKENYSKKQLEYGNQFFPAFSFYEILVTHAEKFFGKEDSFMGRAGLPVILMGLSNKLNEAQQKNEYPTEADEYFRENCILISKKS